MNLKQAKALKAYDIIYHISKQNADGTKMRARVTSVKKWKTRPDEVRVRVKHGLYDYAEFNELDIDQLTLKDD
jgi:hypothetical protein